MTVPTRAHAQARTCSHGQCPIAHMPGRARAQTRTCPHAPHARTLAYLDQQQPKLHATRDLLRLQLQFGSLLRDDTACTGDVHGVRSEFPMHVCGPRPAMLSFAVRCSAVLSDAVPCSAMPQHTAQPHAAIPCRMPPCSAACHHAVPYDTMQGHTAPAAAAAAPAAVTPAALGMPCGAMPRHGIPPASPPAGPGAASGSHCRKPRAKPTA
eukprot:242021-Chlamydomonas_euryale.AAC.6